MAEKRKAKSGTNSRNDSRGGMKKKKSPGSRKKTKREERKGPRIPNSLRREVDLINPRNRYSDDSGSEDIDLQDVYEYDEPMAEEESKKNRRYDAVDNYQYELPEDFKDENISSDDDDNVNHASGSKSSYSSDESGDDEDEDDDGRHAKMLQEITGMPAEAFEGKKKTLDVVSEAYPESEYNPTQDSDGPITVDDLLNPLQKKRGYGDLRKRIHKVESSSLSVQTPISKLMRDNVERKVAYEVTREVITKWEQPVKKNREASTIFFNSDTNVGFSTVGAIASDFKPRTAFEKKMDSLVHDPMIVEAHNEDGARLLELNKISTEDVKERQNLQAKMRSLLFRHEQKAKHIKKIKSKTYHRLLKKNKLKAANAEDPEEAKEAAIKQEYKRAEERLRLKHKHKNKWAERVLKLGLANRDEGTRVALTEQLHQHALLTRKMNSMNESSSSSDEGSDEDDEDDLEISPSREQDASSKLLNKAKEKTIKLMEADNEMPTSGVLSLPFMVRGIKKREEEALKEAEHAVKEYESSLKKLDGSSDGESPKAGTLSGRRVFGAAAKKQSQDSKSMMKTNRRDRDRDTDSEDDYEAKDRLDPEPSKDVVHVNAHMVYEGSDTDLQSIDDIIRDSGPKTTHEVAMFAPNSNKKVSTGNKKVKNDKDVGSHVVVEEPSLPKHDVKEVNNDEDTDSEEEMEDYKLPSQEELIRRAFAGDDVEEEFEKDKQEVLNEENPEPEKPVLVPGWGQWTHVQKKKGMPSWMLAEHEAAKKKRDESIKQRKDAHLKHVVISEKVNKKADKLHVTNLPFPYTSKEAYEQSIRRPIGPDFNPATIVPDLIRPEVVKKAGLIIGPISSKEVNPYERGDGEQRSKEESKKGGNNKSRSGKGNKNKKVK